MSPSVWRLTLCVLGIEREGTSVDDKWSRMAQGLDWDRSPELEPQDEDFKEENKDVLDENIIRKH